VPYLFLSRNDEDGNGATVHPLRSCTMGLLQAMVVMAADDGGGCRCCPARQTHRHLHSSDDDGEGGPGEGRGSCFNPSRAVRSQRFSSTLAVVRRSVALPLLCVVGLCGLAVCGRVRPRPTPLPAGSGAASGHAGTARQVCALCVSVCVCVCVSVQVRGEIMGSQYISYMYRNIGNSQSVGFMINPIISRRTARLVLCRSPRRLTGGVADGRLAPQHVRPGAGSSVRQVGLCCHRYCPRSSPLHIRPSSRR
jgi:hypothetical protein